MYIYIYEMFNHLHDLALWFIVHNTHAYFDSYSEMAFDIMSPETSVVQGKLPHPNINRNAIRRPADMREGNSYFAIEFF